MNEPVTSKGEPITGATMRGTQPTAVSATKPIMRRRLRR
jgi:hypothetical protein